MDSAGCKSAKTEGRGQRSGENLTIREFVPEDQPAFYRINREWILRDFTMEAKDEETLGDPQRTIIDRGGRILIAAEGEEIIGCCALLATRTGEFELAKMAVIDSWQGAGIGRRLLTAAIETARTAGADRLYLETNDKLQVAIRLYESMGFQHLPAERVTPSPYKRSNVVMEMNLSQQH